MDRQLDLRVRRQAQRGAPPRRVLSICTRQPRGERAALRPICAVDEPAPVVRVQSHPSGGLQRERWQHLLLRGADQPGAAGDAAGARPSREQAPWLRCDHVLEVRRTVSVQSM